MRSRAIKLSDRALQREWTAVQQVRSQSERLVEQAARRYMRQQRQRVISRLVGILSERPARAVRSYKADASDVAPFVRVSELFDLREEITALKGILEPQILQVVLDGFEQGLARVEAEGVFNRQSPSVQNTITDLFRKIESVPQTARGRLRDTITESLDVNATVSQMTRSVRGLYDDMTESKAREIAQTTGTGGWESGQLEAWDTAGIKGKQWLYQRDDRVRSSHVEADQQKRALNRPFEVGGAELMHPADPSGPADEVVRCRCTMLPLIDFNPRQINA
jgi:hypothetical protein